MTEHPVNDYSARLYQQRDLQNTDLLAFRCVAEGGLVRGQSVLDLGCGTGRSTRFLKGLGTTVIGVDRNPGMIAEARRRDPAGDYRFVSRGEGLPLPDASCDAVFSSWMILEEGDEAEIIRLLLESRRVVRPGGDVVIVTNTPEFYARHWLSCLVDHPENKPPLRSGQRVRATLLPEGVEVSDYFWSDADYRRFFARAGLQVMAAHRPLGRPDDPFPWRDELVCAPYVIYHLCPAALRQT